MSKVKGGLSTTFAGTLYSKSKSIISGGGGITPEDIRPDNIDIEHYRIVLEQLLILMAPHIQQNIFTMAKMEYSELLKIESALKKSHLNKYQETSKSLPILNKIKDQQWGPNIFEVIVKATGTQVRNLADDALRELNSLQRSAMAHESYTRDSPKESPRGIKTPKATTGTMLGKSVKRKQSVKNKAPDNIPPAPTMSRKTTNLNLDVSFSKSINARPLNVNIPKASPRKEAGTVVLTREVFDQMQRKIDTQEREIEELTTRLSNFASKQLTEGNPNITDLSDQNRPIKIGQRFDALYDDEWSDALAVMTAQLGYTEQEGLYTLLRIVRYAYDFSKKLSESQLEDLRLSMEDHMLHPKQRPLPTSKTPTLGTVGSLPSALDHNRKKILKSVTVKLAKDYRKSTAPVSVPDVQELFKEQILQEKFKLDPSTLPRHLTSYVDLCVELTWLMCVQNPPMVITWATKGETINTDYYRFYSKKGVTVKEAVWPVLFLHVGGPLVSKGFVLPE